MLHTNLYPRQGGGTSPEPCTDDALADVHSTTDIQMLEMHGAASLEPQLFPAVLLRV